MSAPAMRMDDLAVLERRPVEIDSAQLYTEIGLRSFARGVFMKQPSTGAEIGSKRVFRIEPGDLLVSNIFAWEGAVAVADERHRGTVGSHRFMTWSVSPNRADARYLAHYFASDSGLAQLRQASPGSAGRNRTLSISALKEIEVPTPSLDEQRRIADYLDSIRDAGKKARSPGVEARWRATIEQIVGTPDGIQRVVLSEVLDDRAGAAVVDDNIYRIAGVYSFGRGLLDRSSIQGFETKYKSLTQIRIDDVVYSKLGAFEGAVAVVETGFDRAHVSPEFPVFSPRPGYDPGYLRYCFVAASFVQQLGEATSGVGARQKRVSPTRFLSLTVPWRPLDEQEAIARYLDGFTRALELSTKADAVASALLPAARNEVFSAMR